MQIRLSSQNLQELCQELGTALGATYQQDKNEQIWQLPSQLATGTVRRLELRPGLEVLLHNHLNREAIQISTNYSMRSPNIFEL
jgi:hypothetical protein